MILMLPAVSCGCAVSRGCELGRFGDGGVAFVGRWCLPEFVCFRGWNAMRWGVCHKKDVLVW